MGDGSITSCQDQCLTTAELQSCDLKNQFGSDTVGFLSSEPEDISYAFPLPPWDTRGILEVLRFGFGYFG